MTVPQPSASDRLNLNTTIRVAWVHINIKDFVHISTQVPLVIGIPSFLQPMVHASDQEVLFINNIIKFWFTGCGICRFSANWKAGITFCNSSIMLKTGKF